MGNNVFKVLIDRKIKTFVSSFSDDAPRLFMEKGRLTHPGEYGMYRERSLIQLLNTVFTKEYQFGDGFIFNYHSEVSTQCDIIICDAKLDSITTDEVAKFYPVEYVYGIGEVKSTINRTELKEALVKLADAKKIALTRIEQSKDFSSIKADQVMPCSFLICKRIEGFNNITEGYWEDVYADILKECRHNYILSIDDGIIYYDLTVDDVKGNGDKTNASWGHCFCGDKVLDNKIIPVDKENEFYHIFFCRWSSR